MSSFAVPAINWFNAYEHKQLEALISLYDDNATQDCVCDSQKVIAGKEALRAYWIDHFKMHPVDGLATLISHADGALVSYWTSDDAVLAHLTFNELGKIVHVSCGPQVRKIAA
jgi:hypothetical protein